MKLCIPKPLGNYFVCVTPQNKQEVLELVKPWEIVDVHFSNQDGRETYILIHQDPEYNATKEGEGPWLWGYVGEYLLRDASEYADQDEPKQISASLFLAMYLPADCGVTFPVTTQTLLLAQKDYAEWQETFADEEL